MASIALRCLAKARPSPVAPSRLAAALVPTIASSSAPFSTAPALFAEKGKHIIKGRAKKNYKKKASTTKARTPAPGERKAFRKRIQLSNNNAIAVSGLGDLAPESMSSDAAKGTVMGIPDRVVDQLRSVEAFRPGQSWGLFRRPHILVRSEASDVAKMMDKARENKSTLRLVLNGGKVTGKSTMLLSAMTHAFLNKWIVVHIPEGMSHNPRSSEWVPRPPSGLIPAPLNQYLTHV